MPKAPGITAELQKRICRRIERGNYPETAAQAEGVPARTFWDWMRKGRDAGPEPYPSFVAAVDRARAQAEADLVEVIREGDTKEVKRARAAGWLLERTRSKRFGAVIRHRVEDELARMLDIAEAVLARPDFLRLCEAIAAADRADETGEDSGRGTGAEAAGTADGGAAGSDPVH